MSQTVVESNDCFLPQTLMAQIPLRYEKTSGRDDYVLPLLRIQAQKLS